MRLASVRARASRATPTSGTPGIARTSDSCRPWRTRLPCDGLARYCTDSAGLGPSKPSEHQRVSLLATATVSLCGRIERGLVGALGRSRPLAAIVEESDLNRGRGQGWRCSWQAASTRLEHLAN